MRISVTIFVILISMCIVNASVLDPVIENIVHKQATKPPGEVSGIWKKKTVWKPRWVKEWKSAKVTKPVWRKVWSPIQIREWVPMPKPPPGWDTVSMLLAPVHQMPKKAPVKDSQGHDSFPAQTATAVPLWDPVPYPESQQPPPPPPFPQPLQDASCGNGACDSTPAHTFNQQQILEILGPRYQQQTDYYQNPDYSETVNHLTRLPPEGNTWRQPQPLPDFQFDNRFNGFPGLPEFLIPPKTLPDNRLQLPNKPIANNPPAPEPPRWNPLPTDNKPKGHFITKAPDQPYKFEFPDPRNQNSTRHNQNPDNDLREKQNLQANNKNRPHTEGDFIQEAQLVGEYHYSEFDLAGVRQEPNKQAQILPEEQVKPKPQQNVQAKEPQKPAQQQSVVENKQRPNQHSVGENKQRPNQHSVVENKTRPNQQSAAENKPRTNQNAQPQSPNPQGGSHIQKKHIPTTPSKSNYNFEQQEALIKQIFPIFKPLPPVNRTHASNHRPELPTGNKNQENLQNHSSTKLLPVATNSTNIPHRIQVYPVYERPQGVNPNLLPPNHRFSLNPEMKHQEILQNSTKLLPVPAPKTTKPENPIFEKAKTVQLVFATAPDEPFPSEKDNQKTTTTEPYEVVFSSSLLATTEAVTKSPVIIVTPVNSKP